ncbi:quinol monooxygenase YgiN [Rhodococcus sp. 27YEA15]|uniref:putative quinol monooxygenase n=1 Tax=Rhodococcus sp. 27YEA15 TaxID=3156259 RepID=UPI003C7A279D
MKVAQFARFTAKPGQADKVVAALEEASIAARSEEGTLVYAIHVFPDTPDVVWMYELYTDAAAQQAHSSSAATDRLKAAVKDVLAEPLTVSKGNPHSAFGLPE